MEFLQTDGWHSFAVGANGDFSGGFTHRTTGYKFRFAGNMKARTLTVETVDFFDCVWTGSF